MKSLLNKFYLLCLFPLLMGGEGGGLLFSQTWHKLGTGIGYSSICVKCFKQINGDLYIGGGFLAQFGAPANGIVRYNSFTEQWDSLGSGVGGEIYSIETYNGEMYVGGMFPGAIDWSMCGSLCTIPNTYGITKWNGTQWLSVDSVFSNNLQAVSARIYPVKFNNDLYIGGSFYNLPVNNGNAKQVVRYNGSAFDNMLGGVDGFPLAVWNMAVYKNELIVAGEFVQTGNGTGYDMGYYNITRWNDIKWDSLGSGVNGWVGALEVDTINDVLYVGGGFTMAGGVPVRYVAKWDGTQWSAVPPLPTISAVGCLKFFNGKLYAGLDAITGNSTDTLLMYLDSSGWHPVFGPNGQGGVYALEVYNGNLYVGGCFDKVDTTVVNEIACYGDSCPGTPITLTLPYGVNEVNKPQLKFKVYPNPAKKEITVEVASSEKQVTSEKYIVRIKNSLGQKIYEQPFSPVHQSTNPQITISTTGYKKGMYLVEVCTSPFPSGRAGDGLCHTEKVVVE